MVVEALWNRVFEMALTSNIVSDFFMPRDHSRVGALRFAPVCSSVCPSVPHALQYRVCVINSSHSFNGSFEALYIFVDIMKMCMWRFGGDKIFFDRIMAF